MNQMLKTKIEIKAWLDGHNVTNYRLKKDKKYGFCVDVRGDVDLSYKDLKSIDVKFAIVKGTFLCNSNHLTSLQGCPEEVKGKFNCSYNQLFNLVGAPKLVGSAFDCESNELTSLEGAPEQINGFFHCSNNQLTTLEFCPQIVEGVFYCQNNRLNSLEYCPKRVELDIMLDNNPALGVAQDMVIFEGVRELHEEFVRIKKEKKLLDDSMVTCAQLDSKSYKI